MGQVCKQCLICDSLWKSAAVDDKVKDLLIGQFYAGHGLPECLNDTLKLCALSCEEGVSIILNILSRIKCKDIIEVIKSRGARLSVTSKNIPQFSDLDVCVFGVVDSLNRAQIEGVSFKEMGYLLRTEPRSEGADIKYGENQAKTAELMLLCKIDDDHLIHTTLLGRTFNQMTKEEKKRLYPKLLLLIPLIQNYYSCDKDDTYIESSISILKKSTRIRRMSSIKKIIATIDKCITDEL